MARRYSRPISSLERLALTVNELYHYNVDGVLEGIGTVDVEALQAAVNRAAAANPAIRVRLRGWLGFARWVDSGIAPKVRLLPEADWDGNTEAGAPFLKERFDALRGGPVADVLIVPCKDGVTRLVFRTQHAAIDGCGFIHWCMEVARAMRGEPLVGSTSELTDFQVQAQNADKVVSEPPSAPVSCITVVPPGEPDGKPLHYIWRRVLLDRNPTQLMNRTAAFLGEYARRRGPGEVGFTIPVDYRGLRTKEFAMGNLTGYFRLTVPDGADARTLMRQMYNTIRSYADCKPIPGAGALRWLPIAYLRRRMGRKFEGLLYWPNPIFPTGGLVSMGVVQPADYSFPGFVAHAINGIPGAVGKLNVVFLHDMDKATVCFTVPARYNDHGQFDAMVDEFQRRFSRPAQDTPAPSAAVG